MAGSFGGSVKLTGESAYTSALKNITSNLKSVSSELKLASAEFTNNGTKIGDLRTQNDALNKKLQEEQKIVSLCTDAIKDFTDQQTKNKTEIDKLKSSLESEKSTLDKMKSSTTSSSTEISKQQQVVANLEKELSKAESAYDANSRKINDYTTKMNNAKTECSNLSTQINSNNAILSKTKNTFEDNSKSIKEFATEADNAGKSTLSLGDLIKGNLISEGIIAGIKGLASAMKTVGTALLDVGKTAVSSYAEYEQLIGGVETLFEESAGVVENYANNAYKTAGMSANEYMTTVTSFSASLLQSLNGDTAKSAEVADMAITDMSDNANKMGTSMEMIQNAYQGFAKQNYTMLDNLKLGYGGTKTEMERLLADASAISGIDYDISNLNDVYQAIHVIQTEMGITGTTAKEASSTISGSISSMKSAWTNFMTGLADGNANMSDLVSNVVDSATTVVENVMPVVEQVVNSIMEVFPTLLENIMNYLPQFLTTGSNILTSLISGLQANMPAIMTAVMQIVNMLISTLTQNLPQILQMGIQLIVSLVQGIAQSLPTLIPEMVNAVTTMVTTLLDNIDLLVDAGIQLLLGLAEGLIEALPDLIDKIPEIIDKVIEALTNNLPKIIEAGVEITLKLAVGIVQAIPQLVAKVPQIISSFISGVTSLFPKLISLGGDLLNKIKDGILGGLSKITEVGKNVVQGLWNGINNAKDWVLDKIKGFGSAILDGIKGFFGIHSPSTLFRDEIGSNLAKGVGVGFENEMTSVTKDIQKALPTDFDIASNINVSKNLDNSNSNAFSSNTAYLINALQEALEGMAFKIDGDKFGELVVDDIERVIYS